MYTELKHKHNLQVSAQTHTATNSNFTVEKSCAHEWQ